jgi:hypothetical protein
MRDVQAAAWDCPRRRTANAAIQALVIKSWGLPYRIS